MALTQASLATEFKDGLAALVAKAKAFFEAHPDLESDAATDLKDAVDTAAPLAEKAVEEVAPPTLAETFDAAIANEQTQADAASAKIQADAQARIQALQQAKANAQAAAAAAAQADQGQTAAA